MSSLRRTMAAGFTLTDAVTIDDVQAQGEALLLPVDRFFDRYPALTLPNARLEKLCRCGNPLKLSDTADGTYRIYGQNGDFLCLSEAKDGTLTSIKNFFGA